MSTWTLGTAYGIIPLAYNIVVLCNLVEQVSKELRLLEEKKKKSVRSPAQRFLILFGGITLELRLQEVVCNVVNTDNILHIINTNVSDQKQEEGMEGCYGENKWPRQEVRNTVIFDLQV